eukprot:7693813-Lingulodinium_polyedra.AAC.1
MVAGLSLEHLLEYVIQRLPLAGRRVSSLRRGRDRAVAAGCARTERRSGRLRNLGTGHGAGGTGITRESQTGD